MLVAGYLIGSPHIRINDYRGPKFIGLPNGPPPVNGHFTPSKLKERVKLVFQMLPKKAKNMVIVNSTLAEFDLIQACVEVADEYSDNVMVIPPLLARLTYAMENLSKLRNPPKNEVILVATLTTKFIDFVVLRRNQNFELFVAVHEKFEPNQFAKMFQKFYDLNKPNATIILVQDNLYSTADEIRHKLKPKNCYIKSFKKWDYILLHGGLLRAMNDEDGFDSRYHIPNFSSGYETLITKPGTRKEEEHILLPERSALPCEIHGFNGIPQKFKIFYSLEYYQRICDFVSWRTVAARTTVKASGTSKENIGYVNERGIPYLTLTKNTVESKKKMTFVNKQFQKKESNISHPKILSVQSSVPDIQFLFRDNCYAIEVYQNGVSKVLTDSFGNIWTPLYLSMAENTVKIGQEAKIHVGKFPKFVIYDILQIIGKPINEIKIDPKWGFKLVENNGNVYFQIETLLNGPRLFPPELVLSAFLKVMKIQTQTFLENQNGAKEIQISTNFQFRESQKAVFQKAAAKNDLSILSFVVSGLLL